MFKIVGIMLLIYLSFGTIAIIIICIFDKAIKPLIIKKRIKRLNMEISSIIDDIELNYQLARLKFDGQIVMDRLQGRPICYSYSIEKQLMNNLRNKFDDGDILGKIRRECENRGYKFSENLPYKINNRNEYILRILL